MFFKFLCDKSTLHPSLLLYRILWKSLCIAHTYSVGSNTQPLHRQCLSKLSLILLHGNIISFLHLFIYSFIYLFICSSMDLQVNILYFWLQPSTCLFFLLLKLLLLWPLGVLPVGSCSIGICPFLCFCFVFSTSLLSGLDDSAG